MLKKTHIAVASATALAITHPTTVPLMSATVIAASFASLMPDIDTEKGTAHKWAVATVTAFFGLTVLLAVLNYREGGQLLDEFLHADEMHSLRMQATGIIILVISCLIGFFKHRHYMHSFMGCIVFTAGIHLVLGDTAFTYAFLTGYLSHLLIDLLNYKGCLLLWPMNKGFCLKLCKSDGIVNFLMGTAATAVCFFEAFMLLQYGDNALNVLHAWIMETVKNRI